MSIWNEMAVLEFEQFEAALDEKLRSCVRDIQWLNICQQAQD